MKDVKIFLGFCFIGFMFCSCEETENPSNERRFNVSDYNAIEIGGNVVIKIQGEGSTSGNQTIIVKGNPQLISTFNVVVAGGVFRLEGSPQVDLADSIVVITPALNLSSIVLEADQMATVVWEDSDDLTAFDHLDIKTEANSVLELVGLRTANINIQQEAASEVLLSGSTLAHEEYKVEKEKVEFLNDSTALVDGVTLWHTDLVSEVNEKGIDYYVFTGEETRSFFVTDGVTAVLQATTELFADGLPVRNFDIKLEGQSIAHIWVSESLTGKGEGESILYYTGDPAIDYLTQGSAQIVNSVDFD